jgi:hypothetical protein
MLRLCKYVELYCRIRLEDDYEECGMIRNEVIIADIK